MNWTEEQKQAIEIKDKSMLVSAAAGSGKTAVLVERIKQLIVKDGVSLDEMLVVTFTNAAASEMREKIVSAVPEQMSQIHKAHISTFHSFALEVIRRYFHLLGIEPNFKICDDAQRILLQSEAMEQLFRERFQSQDQSFLHFIRIYGSSRNEDAVKAMISETYNFIQSLPDPFSWLEQKAGFLSLDIQGFKDSILYTELLASIDDELAVTAAMCRQVSEVVAGLGLESLIPKAESDLCMLEEIREKVKEDYDKGAMAVAMASFQRFSAGKEDKEVYETVREDITFLRYKAKDSLKKLAAGYFAKTLEEYISEINSTYEDALILKNLVLDFNKLYSKAKKSRGLIDFSDIEHHALSILSDESASSEYRKKFRYIFIDEYQDSNLVQEAIVDRIKRSDNVFMVGDVKQSIYKFRLAEPEIFIKKYELFKRGNDSSAIKLDLNRNFRSKEPILRMVNHLFRRIMDQKRTGIDYDDEAALYKGVSYEGPLEYKVEFHLLEGKKVEDADLDEEIKAMKKAETEAFVAASIIKEARGKPYYCEKAKLERRFAYKDIVILLRSASGMADIYQEVLEQEGIPAYVDTGDGYFDTLEVSVFINLLKTIDNKKQDVPLLSILRSSIFDFSINDLALIRCEYREGSYFNALLNYHKEGKDEALSRQCGLVLNRLEEWKRQARLLPLTDFIWKLMQSTGYYSYVGALPGATQRQANLKALADKALTFENSLGKGLFGFINYIEAVKERKIATAPIKLLGESDDVVKIMTVHKSKGLEFPMVLLGGLGRAFHREGGKSVSFHKELGVALKQVDEGRRCCRRTLLQNIIDVRLAKEAAAEEIRILYVALTRAMDKSVLLGTATDIENTVKRAKALSENNLINGRSYLDFLLPALWSNKEISFHIHDRHSLSLIRNKQHGAMIRLKEDMDRGFIETGEISGPVRERLNWKYGYHVALNSKSKYSVSELSRQESAGLKARDGKLKSEKAAEGILYHRIMEHIPLHGAARGIEYIKGYMQELVSRELMTEAELSNIDPQKIHRFFQSLLGQRLCKAEKIYREKAFNLLYEKDGEEVIIQGIIDCCFIEDGRYVLIDFKTDYAGRNEESIDRVVDNYRPQLQLYKQALEQIQGAVVEEMYLYLFSADKAVRL